MAGQSWWGATQWAAYLVHQEQPIKAASKTARSRWELRFGDALSGTRLRWPDAGRSDAGATSDPRQPMTDCRGEWHVISLRLLA